VSLLQEITAALGALPEAERAKVAEMAMAATAGLKWVPNPGPQTEAYMSKADCLLYGGEPGGGKSQLLLGLAFNAHQRSLIMRREYGDLERLIDDSLKIHGSREGFNGSPPPRLRHGDEKVINFRAAQHVGDEQSTMGQGRDFLGLDEATHFAESQVRFLMGWVRTETPGQRCRTVLATNPPLTAEGLWVVSMFAPWLDPNYQNPAKPGELRWVISGEDGKDEWVKGPDDFRLNSKGEQIFPTSRTFIPASVDDNPYYVDSGYKKTLQGLPENIRSLLMGGFRTTFKDDDYQVIPTAWIDAAMERWKPDGFKGWTMTAMAIDPADGGEDAEVIAARHGGWYHPLQARAGEATADPGVAFGHIMTTRRDAAPVIVDLGGGYGGKLTLRLQDNKVPHIGFNGAGASTKTAKGSRVRYSNKRAEAWFTFRDELDPNQDGGSAIALPPDPELKADLASVRYDPHALQVRGVFQIESKEQIRKRLGRSPGKGDAVVMCLTEGAAAIQRAAFGFSENMPSTANTSRAALKRRH
jgi:hypothetical protein